MLPHLIFGKIVIKHQKISVYVYIGFLRRYGVSIFQSNAGNGPDSHFLIFPLLKPLIQYHTKEIFHLGLNPTIHEIDITCMVWGRIKEVHIVIMYKALYFLGGI